ncbi:MAG: AAA family ATPase [Chloroflexota bacterium]|nr:AAA family ATPase [Chloroflexota bacterium]
MPGTGKSTVALALGEEFGIPVIDKDVIVSAMLDRGVAEEIAHPAAYQTTFALVEHLICVQHLSVIVDTPAGEPSMLEWATQLCADASAILIPVLCSADGEVLYDRMAAREGLRSHSKGTSRRPGTARERFAHFPDDTIELDAMRPVEDVVQEAISTVRMWLATITDHPQMK